MGGGDGGGVVTHQVEREWGEEVVDVKCGVWRYGVVSHAALMGDVLCRRCATPGDGS